MKVLYKRIISIVLIFAIFYFIGNIAYKEWHEISGYNWSPHLPLLIASVILCFITYLLSAYGWTLILRMMGVNLNWRKGLPIFLLSIFGRYIPGGIWTMMGRVYLCRLEGIPDSMSSMSILLEQAYPVVTAGFVFVASLLLWDDIASVARVLPLIILLPLFFVFLHPKPFLKIMNPILSRFGKRPISISLSFSDVLKLEIV